MVSRIVLSRLATGELSEIYVASVEASVAAALGAVHVRDVILSRETFLHIRDIHPDIGLEEFALLPDAIRRGLVIVENKKPNFATICYQSAVEGRRYAVPIKAAANGREIFVRSFHRTRKRQTAAFLKRGKIVRTHK